MIYLYEKLADFFHCIGCFADEGSAETEKKRLEKSTGREYKIIKGGELIPQKEKR